MDVKITGLIPVERQDQFLPFTYNLTRKLSNVIFEPRGGHYVNYII